jgi:DNA invertase Pin-like site-specific DNA recombinase
MKNNLDNNFAEMIMQMLAEAELAIDSARMSDDFLAAADESLSQIPNIMGMQMPMEQNVNTPDAS